MLRRQITSGIILLLGNEESPMNYADNCYHFRQDSTFLYYFGMDYPSLCGIMDADEGKDILFGDDLSIDMIVWMGKQPILASRSLQYGIEQTRPLSALQQFLQHAIEIGRPLHFLPPYRPENLAKLSDLLGIPLAGIRDKSSVKLVKAIVAQREIKSPEEVAEIEKGVDISADMHLEAMKMARPGMKESEIAARVTQVALAAGGELAFPVIATINGQTLHNHYHGNMLKEGDMVLIDCGAETAFHYAGDLSSTYPVSEKFTTRQKEIYQVALDAHEAAIAALKPGKPFLEVHFTACRTIFEGMKTLGLTKGNSEEAMAAGAHALFFPCGTGHMMGLDVHDMEDLGEQWVGYDGEPKSKLFGLKSLRLAKPLKPGFVLTIEPGIYFIPDLIDMWRAEGRFKEFLNFDTIDTYRTFGGIRNEEDYLITSQGARLLGKPIPKTIADVESLRKR